MSSLEIVLLQGRPREWDRIIKGYATKTLYHESSWLDFVRMMHPNGSIEHFAICRGGGVVGYFCALHARKALFNVYGSPLPDAGMYMGPLVNADVAQADLIPALLALCRSRRIASIELANDWLDPHLMRRLGFKVSPNVTHVCPLASDEKTAWAAMRGTCRTRIRKAEKLGLEAEITDDPEVADDFFRYYGMVLHAKGRAGPHYGIERPRALMSALQPADRLFAVRVRYKGTVIGAGFYPHDERAMYYWDGASDPALLELCPNELLHWTAMREAIRRGIPLFNIGGGPVPSRFTRKFGGEDRPYITYRKNFIPFLESARAFYHFFDFLRLFPMREQPVVSPVVVRHPSKAAPK